MLLGETGKRASPESQFLRIDVHIPSMSYSQETRVFCSYDRHILIVFYCKCCTAYSEIFSFSHLAVVNHGMAGACVKMMYLKTISHTHRMDIPACCHPPVYQTSTVREVFHRSEPCATLSAGAIYKYREY